MTSITYIQLTREELSAVAREAAADALRLAARKTGEVMSRRDLARHFDVDPKTITNWEKIGRIPASKNGYWNRADILELPKNSPK